jgi:DHA1 family inner membrane transport protein
MTHGRSIATITVLTTGMVFTGMSVALIAALLVNISRDIEVTVGTAGQIITIAAILSGILSPVIGPLSDRLGRKRLLIVGLITIGIAFIGYSLTKEFSIIIGFSVLLGLGTAMAFPNILSSVGDYFPLKRQGTAMAIVNLGPPIATIGGVPLGALIADRYGWQTSILCVGVGMLVIAFLILIILPSLKPVRSPQDISYLSKLREVLRQKNVLYILASNIMMSGTFQTIDIYLVAFLMVSYSLKIGQVAPFISLMAIGQFAGTLLGGQMADRLNKLKICIISIALCGVIGLLLILFPQHMWLSVLLGAFFRGIYALNRPAYFTIMISISPKGRGTIMGFSAMSIQVGRTLGAMLGGLLVAYFGYSYIGVLSFVFSIIAVIILTCINRIPHLFEQKEEE